MDRFVWLFAILVALFLAACDSNSPGGIRLHYSWVDSEGNDITPPDLSLLFAWGELKYGSETKTSEAAWLGDDDATLRFTGLPYGVSMSLTLTMRAADTEGDDSDIIGLDDVPEVRTDNIVYYCTSQAFSLTRGKVTDVLNACVMQKGAAWNDDGSGAPAMRLFYAARGTGEPVELTAEANVTPHAAIEIHVDPRTADSIVAANDPAFTIGRTAYAVAALSKDIDGFAIIPAWDLNGGLFTEQGTAPDGVRVIYVKLKQNIGFESPAADAKVVLDTTPPRVVSRSFLRDPAYAPSTEEAGNDDASGADELPDDDTLPAEETTKVYHLSAHDPLAQGATVTGMLTLFADEPVSGAAAFVRNVNTDEVMTLGDIGLLLSSVAQNEMTFSGPITDDPTLDGTYEVLVQLTDAVENADEEPVAVEQLLLILHNTTPTTENVDMGKVRYRRIPWGSDETEGTPRFSVVAEPGAVAGGDIATAIAYRAEEASPGNIIGTAAVGSDGSFTVTDMTGGDLPNIYLSLATRSGAVMPPTLITEVEWIATMGEKVPGSILENPHTLITTGTITQTLEQKGYFFQEPPGGGSEEIVRSGIGSWAQRNNDNGVPSMRSGHAMAYDSAHGKVLVFGGNAGGEYSDETWEWDGTNWTLLNPATKPSARAMHAMTYDSARGKVVLFGGVAGAYNNETWEWDGTNWTLMTPANKPTARTSHAMAYDSVRGKVVLFGGEFGGENGPENYDETWEWDGANWTQLNPMNKPSARSCHAMVYDSGHGSVILFGGINYPDYFSIVEKNDTWEWDGQNWTQLNPASKPSARGYHAMAYYSTRGKVVLFGGSSGDDETWEWDGTNWTQMSPATKPSARHGHAMAYDGARGKMVLFGENTDSAWNVETWEWDGADWTLWHTVNSPSARIMLAMAHDETRRRVLLFGGWTGEYNDETWEWSGNNWTQLNPATKPSARCSHAMAYDSERGKMVLFGGETGESAYSDDTWEWDGQNWTQLNPASKPSARSAHAMAYDSERGKVVLFGGETGELAYSDDTWEWDGQNWTQLNPASKPSARFSHAMAYDNVRGRVVLFGGAGADYNDETWEWDGANWTQMYPVAKPSAMFQHAMAYDISRGKVVLVGGRNNSTSSKKGTLEWDGNSWTYRNSAISPLAPYWHSMSFDNVRGKVVAFGGSSPTGASNETWEWDGGGNDRAGQIMNISWESAGITDDDSIQSVSVLFNAGGLGDITGTPTNGVDLMTWKHDRWVTVSSNTAAPDNLAPVTWTTTDPVEIQTLLNSGLRKFNFAVVPSAPNGFLTEMGKIATDYAEVIVRYSIP